MKNNALDAYQRRDTATQAGLLTDKANYAPLEDDLAPLRDQHTANLALVNERIDDVLAADSDDSAAVKTKTKTLLLPLLLRLSAAMQATVESQLAKKPDDEAAAAQLHRVALGSDVLRRADEDTFGRLATGLLTEAAAFTPAQFAKREFTADDLAETTRLLKRFTGRLGTGRLADVAGKSDREVLSALLAANQQLIKKIRKQLLPYKGSAKKHDVWLRFQGYSKVVLRKGGGGKATGTDPVK